MIIWLIRVRPKRETVRSNLKGRVVGKYTVEMEMYDIVIPISSTFVVKLREEIFSIWVCGK